MKMAKTLARVHTHTHTHTSILKNKRYNEVANCILNEKSVVVFFSQANNTLNREVNVKFNRCNKKEDSFIRTQYKCAL